MPNIPGYPLSRLLDRDGNGPNAVAWASLGDADVIIGRDRETEEEFVVFGRDTLKHVAEGQDVAEGYNILCVEVDLAGPNGELDLLLDLVQQAKGRHDFIDFERGEHI